MWNLLYKFVVWFLYPDLQIFTRAYLDIFNEIFYTGEIWVLSKECSSWALSHHFNSTKLKKNQKNPRKWHIPQHIRLFVLIFFLDVPLSSVSGQLGNQATNVTCVVLDSGNSSCDVSARPDVLRCTELVTPSSSHACSQMPIKPYDFYKACDPAWKCHKSHLCLLCLEYGSGLRKVIHCFQINHTK